MAKDEWIFDWETVRDDIKNRVKTRSKKIKTHVKEHKREYIVGGVCLVVGGVVTYVIVKHSSSSPDVTIAGQVNEGFTVVDKSTNNIFANFLITPPGNSGNVIMDTATGTIYHSQEAAAKAFGKSASHLSQHLNGKNSDFAGHVFTKLIDGGAPHLLKPA